jgi:hypothetical protein
MSKVHGEFNLEQRLRQNIEECKNGKPEPRVYRLDTKEVLKLFEEKQVAEIEKQAMVDSLVKDMDMVE